ncbi:MAG: BMC domain-containing protein, partial [Fretibacterium sp.]
MTVVRTGALGMIETRGLLGAIEAADAALKSASVSLIGARKVGGGLVTVLLSGDVAAVRSAVDAASASLSKLGIGFSAHVIPRLDPEAWRLVDLNVGLTEDVG